MLWHHFRGGLVVVLPRIDAAGAAVNRADVDGERRKHGAGSGAAVAEQRPPPAASPRAAVQVVMLQPLLAAARACLCTPDPYSGWLEREIFSNVNTHNTKQL